MTTEDVRRLRDLMVQVLRDHDGGPNAEYCWWCEQDINGMHGEKQDHAPDCFSRVEALLPLLDPPAQEPLLEKVKAFAQHNFDEAIKQCRRAEAAEARVKALEQELTQEQDEVLRLRRELELVDAMCSRQSEALVRSDKELAQLHQLRTRLAAHAELVGTRPLCDESIPLKKSPENFNAEDSVKVCFNSRGGTPPIDVEHAVEDRHRTIPVSVLVEIDAGIADVVCELNHIEDIRTYASCQGGTYRAYVMVGWLNASALERLQKLTDVEVLGEALGYVHPVDGRLVPPSASITEPHS